VDVEIEVAELLGSGRADVVRMLLTRSELVVDAVALIVSNEIDVVSEPVPVDVSEELVTVEADVKVGGSPVKFEVEGAKLDDSMLDVAVVDAVTVLGAKLSTLAVSSVVVLSGTNGNVDELRLVADSVAPVNPSVVAVAVSSSLVVVDIGTA
jgi:hypothetical protein